MPCTTHANSRPARHPQPKPSSLLAWLARALLPALALSLSGLAQAEVRRVEILERSLFAEGRQPWSKAGEADAGPYERLRGRLHLETDPLHPANARISDLKLAPRNARGMVESWTDFFLLKPVDAGKGNGTLLFEVNNRGNMLALWTFNDGERSNDPKTAAHAGQGFLMRHGFSLLCCGWNGEVQADDTQRLLCGLPLASENGKTITGLAHLEISSTEPVLSRAFSWSPWGIGAAFAAADLNPQHASLSMRPHRAAPAIRLEPAQWAFGRWEHGQLIPDPTYLHVRDGLRPGWLYDLVYTAKAPRVSGLGLCAIRDAVALMRHGDATLNPMAKAIEKTLVFGISQSGRVIHHFLHEGLNGDEAGRQVFDGALIHVAGAGKGAFNHRFRMSTDFGTQHEGHLSGSEFFPLAPVQQTDPVTGASGDSLERTRKAGQLPRLIFTQSSTEYWSRAASLLHSDLEGRTDLKLPEDLRLYLVAGAQHLGKSDGSPGICQQPRNTLDDRGPVLRAMLLHLLRWVKEGKAPPPNRHPRLADHSLVRFEEWKAQFPKLPGLNLPSHAYQPPRLDFGPRFHTQGIADILPPKTGKAMVTLLPAVDADGNETSGIRLPEVAVPLGTHTGWNLRSPNAGAAEMLSPLDGMFLPFAKTKAERQQRGDPRPSLQERYPTPADYLQRLAKAAKTLQDEGFLLPEDRQRLLEQAEAAHGSRQTW